VYFELPLNSGKYFCISGNRYEGNWRNGMKNGRGNRKREYIIKDN